jgi:uncharacterized protein (DUF1778 family)
MQDCRLLNNGRWLQHSCREARLRVSEPARRGRIVANNAVKRPVQVRLAASAREFLVHTAQERGQTRSDVVAEALECLREQRVQALMEEGYREIGASQRAVIEAGLAAALPVIPR